MRMWAACRHACVLSTVCLHCLGPARGFLEEHQVTRALCAVALGQGSGPRCRGPSSARWSRPAGGWGKGGSTVASRLLVISNVCKGTEARDSLRKPGSKCPGLPSSSIFHLPSSAVSASSTSAQALKSWAGVTMSGPAPRAQTSLRLSCQFSGGLRVSECRGSGQLQPEAKPASPMTEWLLTKEDGPRDMPLPLTDLLRIESSQRGLASAGSR